MTTNGDPVLVPQWLAMTEPLRHEMPPGPAADWTEEDHRKAGEILQKCVAFACALTSAPMGTAEQQGLFGAWASNMAALHVVPNDYPFRSDLIAKVGEQYAALKPLLQPGDGAPA